MTMPAGTVHLEYPEVKDDLTLIVWTALACVLERVEHVGLRGKRATEERAARLTAYRAVRRLFLAIPGNTEPDWREYAGTLAYELGRVAQFTGLELALSGSAVSA